MAKLWSNEELAELKGMYSENFKISEISKRLNRSEGAIRNKAYELKITNDTHFTSEEIEYIKENYSQMNIRELADELGRSENWQNVCRTAKRLGLTGNKKRVRHKDQPIPVARENKYSTDEERREAFSAFMKEWHKNNEHPRGMKGKTHNEEYRNRRSKIMKEQWNDPDSYFNSEEHRIKTSERMSKTMTKRLRKNPKSVYTRGKGGTRKDIGIYVRSTWEANVARYLNFLKEKGSISKWEYEPDTFWFENIKRGTRSYTPDFKIWDKEDSEPYYWEVKGYMDAKSKTKLKRMAKYYPDIKVKIVGEKEYKAISELKRAIPNWE